MGIKLTPEKTALIKEAFEKMQTREDLLNLLNEVAAIQESWYQQRIIIKSSVSLKELFENPGISLEELFKKKEKNLITQKQLDFFSTSFEGKDKKRNRYTRFYIRKKSGNLREIKAPLPKLKEIQRAINNILQSVYTVQEQAYGFVPGKSIADNAKIHAGASFVLNIDIKDFFPSIHFRRIKLMLEKAPFNLTGEKEPLAFMIANLCTEEGVLPQGAPTSPLLTNIVCQRLDRRLQELATQYKAAYSRYADDITFSCNEYIFTQRFMLRLEKILKDDRFEMNAEKTRIQGKAFRQEVTGITVNEKVNVSKQFYRSYRTLLHLYKTKGGEKALEYHRRRMPASVAILKMRQEIKNPEIYMQNVIWGKYYFMIMVKGKSQLLPPFEKIAPEVKIGNAIYTLRNNTFVAPLITEKEEELSGYSINTDKESIDIVSDGGEQYNVSEREGTASQNLIEKILSAWEKELNNGGFKNAMEIIKQQSNE